MLPLALFLLHFTVTCAMGGIMWFVQLAYYPNLAAVGRDSVVHYQREHIRRITGIAWTMLVIELATALALVFVSPARVPHAIVLTNAALVVAIWCSTWFVQVPLHKVLEQRWDGSAHARLVRTNWFRTIVYTLRGALLLGAMWMIVAG
jgi:hypothetical protein